jgi:hypothetical protein
MRFNEVVGYLKISTSFQTTVIIIIIIIIIMTITIIELI